MSGALEWFLLARGERVVRVPLKLMAGARSSARDEAFQVARELRAVARERHALREHGVARAARGRRHRVLWAGRTGDPHGRRPHDGLLEIEPRDVLAELAVLPYRAYPGDIPTAVVRIRLSRWVDVGLGCLPGRLRSWS